MIALLANDLIVVRDPILGPVGPRLDAERLIGGEWVSPSSRQLTDPLVLANQGGHRVEVLCIHRARSFLQAVFLPDYPSTVEGLSMLSESFSSEDGNARFRKCTGLAWFDGRIAVCALRDDLGPE